MTQSFGDYDDQIDRNAETQAIVENPPHAVGNPGPTSILSGLKAKFEAAEAKPPTKYIVARNELIPDLVIEVNTKMGEVEYRTFQDASRLAPTNRAAKRSGEKGHVSAERFGATLLAEKTVALYNGDPEKVDPESDPAGGLLTFQSKALLNQLGFDEGDAVNALIALFGFPTLLALGEAYLAAIGFGEDADIVSPTHGSSGV